MSATRREFAGFVCGAITAALVSACSSTGAAEAGTTSPRTTEPAWVYHKGTFYWPGDYSFAAKPFYGDASSAGVGGFKPIKVEVTSPWGGFLPFARNWAFDSRPYTFLTFALKPTIAGQKAQVYFVKVGDVPVGVVVDPFNGKYGPPPQPGVWSTYRIPLADLGVQGTSIYKFAIQDQSGLPHNVFYLDDVGFAPPEP